MNKYLVRVWVEEVIYNRRTVWVEADSFESIQAMSNNEFATAIDDYDDVIDSDYGGTEPDMWDMDSIELDEEHPDNDIGFKITPSDEKPDVEDIHPDTGRGKQ
mgnify:CR=1 FL=1|jgi:hypothetical protein|tara:strand:+ start:1924 stop:2232 length:309 start_codon:yes stop_codon:yes gene_type:complete